MPTRTGPWPGWPGTGSVRAKPRNAAIDDAWVDPAHSLVIDAEPVLHVRFVVLDDDIGACGELHKNRVAFLAFEIEGHRPLVAVQVLEIGPIAAAACRVD